MRQASRRGLSESGARSDFPAKQRQRASLPASRGSAGTYFALPFVLAQVKFQSMHNLHGLEHEGALAGIGSDDDGIIQNVRRLDN
jgi:hypothetical protein